MVWLSTQDPSSGKIYWYDPNDPSRTTWSDPTKVWAEANDPATGKPYWYNTMDTSEVTWEMPEHFQGGMPQHQQHLPEGYTAADMPPPRQNQGPTANVWV